MSKEKKKKKGIVGKVIRTILSVVLCVVLAGLTFAVNTILPANDRMVNSIAGGYSRKVDNKSGDTSNLDLEYNKGDYTKDTIAAAEEDLKQRISNEGLVLLKNDNSALPMAKDITVSLFSANAANLSAGGGTDLKTEFENSGIKVNETLWNFYKKGDGKGYGLASGSISYGDGEDFRINECPLSVMKDADVLSSTEGTVPVYVLKRVAGEGRDMPRSMYNHADNAEDQARTYLEPDSTELEILSYLNDNFENVVLVLNSNAALELSWLEQFPHITSVINAPDGLLALAEVITGEVNPSGRTVDTFAADALASPAAQNFGDYQYVNEDGTLSKYNYVSYAEGIYVGYKYYETRYEDTVLGQGNAGDFTYSNEVVFPFGYGLSFTDFEWSNYKTSWDGTTCTVTVDVTNTGDAAGKDVVEIYAQSPYTDYDKENKVEKSSVELVGYGKTSELEPGQAETVTVTFDQEQLKSYDYTNAKTYILDAGTYYITAGKNAHDAVNNILAAKDVKDTKLEGTGSASLVDTYEPENKDVDTSLYSKDSYTGVEITNLLDEAAGDITYLTRSDWEGTFPQHDGTPTEQISTWGNEINGEDGVSYTYGKTASADLIAKLDALDSGNPEDTSAITDTPVYGKDNELRLIQLRGLEYDDPMWDDLLDQLTAEDYETLIEDAGYGTAEIASINKPFNMDADSAAGLFYGGSKMMGVTFPNPMTLTQTWNQDLALEYGEMIGSEALIGGADGWYAPSMNIHRTPFSGRNGEYYSEDAFLSGTVGSKEVYGAASKGMYTFIKHFAFNDQEDHRGDREGQFSVATWLNEQAAREIYLVPFEMSMKVGDVELNYVKTNEDGTYENATKEIRACQAVMTGFNRVGYTWVGGSYAMMTGLLRNEWGFNGFILTDNANTSVFMSSDQMTASGADGKLTYGSNMVRRDFDSDNAVEYHYAREGIHHQLYTIVNSKAMNGVAPFGKFVHTATLIDKVRVIVTVVSVLLICLMVYRTIRRFRPKKEKATVEIG